MSGDGRDRAARGPRLDRRWLWLACGFFALAAVLSASGNRLGALSGSAPVDGPTTFRGEEQLGTRGPDSLQGTPNSDLLFTFGGPDRIDAGGSNDLIDPGNGEDVVDAGSGDDHIRAFDGERDVIRCGPGYDVVYADPIDVLTDCEEWLEAADVSWPRTPDPPAVGGRTSAYVAEPLARGSVTLEDEAWVCRGPVDMDLVKVTIHRRSTPLDAVSLAQNCSGRIGRIEVDTWSGDGIKVQNAGAVAHDLVVESGYVRCYERTGGYHQDGIHVMGGRRITFRNLVVSCGRPGVNANLFIAQGGKAASKPTQVVFESGRLGASAAHTILLADAVRSGVRRTVICPGRWFDFMIQRTAIAPVDAENVRPSARDARCVATATG